jgi:WD40 repeat protein
VAPVDPPAASSVPEDFGVSDQPLANKVLEPPDQESSGRATEAQKKNLPLGLAAAVAGVLILIVALGIAAVHNRVAGGTSSAPASPTNSAAQPDAAATPRDTPGGAARSEAGQPATGDPRVTLTLVYTLQHPTQDGQLKVIFSPDGRLLASGDMAQDKIKIWDVASRTELRTINGDDPWLHSIAFSPDSELLESGDQAAIKGWDVSTGAEVRRIEVPSYVMTLGPGGQYIAAGCLDKTIRFWRAATGAELGRYPPQGYIAGAIAFGPGGVTLAVGHNDNTIHLWDVSSAKELRVLSQATAAVIPVDSTVFSPDGGLLASSSYKTITLWDPTTGTALRTLTGHTDAVTAIAFSPDGQLLASASADKTIRLWSPSTGKDLGAYNGQQSVAFSPDGSFLATGGKQISVYRITVEK